MYQYVQTHINHITFINTVDETRFWKLWQTLSIKFIPWSSPLIWECLQTQPLACGILCLRATV